MATFTLADLMRDRHGGGADAAPAPQGGLANYQAQPVVFLGENAQTANHDALARAREMWARGEDAEAVRRQTGWFMHAGMPWFEGDDRGFRQTAPLPPPSAGDTRFFDYFDHPEVLRAYPHMREQLMLNTNPRQFASPTNLAEYLMVDGTPQDGPPRIRLRERNFPNTRGEAGNITTPLHELDHAVANQAGYLNVPGNDRDWPNHRVDPAEQLAYETERRRMLSPEERLTTPFRGFSLSPRNRTAGP